MVEDPLAISGISIEPQKVEADEKQETGLIAYIYLLLNCPHHQLGNAGIVSGGCGCLGSMLL